MADLKLYNLQPQVSPNELRERLSQARLYLALTHELRRRIFGPKRRAISESDMEALLIAVCVFIGDAEGRPTGASKLASHSGIPRTTVYRRLDELMRLKKVVKVGRNYHLAQDAVTPDNDGRLARIFEKFWNS